MFEELYDKVMENSLSEELSKEEKARIREELKSPEIKPQPFDVSLTGWLARIGLWGKLKFFYTNPDEKIKKRRIDKKEFIKILTDDSLINLYGEWEQKQLDFNKLQMYRTYPGLKKRKNTEEILLVIDLRPELKKAIKWWDRFF